MITLHFDHLGIICANEAEGREFLQNAFSIRNWSESILDPIQKVRVSFGHDRSGMCYELISPVADDAPIQKSLGQRTNILNHVAYCTPDLDVAAEHFREQGCFPVTKPAPAAAFNNSRIQFFYSPMDFIFELIESEQSFNGLKAK